MSLLQKQGCGRKASTTLGVIEINSLTGFMNLRYEICISSHTAHPNLILQISEYYRRPGITFISEIGTRKQRETTINEII